MSTTAPIDKAGRVVVPKAIRDEMNLSEGSRLKIERVGDMIQLSVELAPANIEQGDDGLPVLVGWDGYDAAGAVRNMRTEQVAQLDKKRESGR